MADDVVDVVPLWMSQRGLLLVIGMALFAVMYIAIMYLTVAYKTSVDMTGLGIIGGFVAAGGAFFFKDKGAEAVQKISDTFTKVE